MRALAREVAFKKIYSSLFLSKEENNLDKFFDIDNLENEEDKQFASQLVELYEEHSKEIEEQINSKLVDFSPERIFKIDRAILSLALAEILYYKQTPVSVVINEAVKFAKKYSSEKSYSFVNGVLKSIIKDE